MNGTDCAGRQRSPLANCTTPDFTAMPVNQADPELPETAPGEEGIQEPMKRTGEMSTLVDPLLSWIPGFLLNLSLSP